MMDGCQLVLTNLIHSLDKRWPEEGELPLHLLVVALCTPKESVERQSFETFNWQSTTSVHGAAVEDQQITWRKIEAVHHPIFVHDRDEVFPTKGKDKGCAPARSVELALCEYKQT